MGIEHRWSSRKNINIDVSLYYPPVGMINGKTRNISLEGMFIDLKGVSLPPQARLGVGLMLQHVGYREFDALRYMLNAA